MNIKNAKIDAYATCGKTAIVKGVRIKYKYADGKRTNEQDGYTVTCVLPERDYEELAVSVPTLSAELEQCTGNPVVQFDGPTMSIYGRPDDLRIAAKASAVRIVDGKTKT